MVSCDLLSGLVSHDPEKLQATLLAGTRLNAIGPLLQGVGQALPNMPDRDYPSLGGSIASSVHATGVEFGSMSDYVRGLTLATRGGELLQCSASENPELFHAAKTSVGALGIVTKITLQNQAPFAVIEKVFRKNGARPHWGKLHTLGAAELAALYPRHWQDFQEVRRELDPAGKMLNAHLRKLFVG
jgi:FAD/FMN-containing dehydrogenase